ncbi:MAG: condensation domain-containing protein, partial [Acidobacteriota bacterium]
TASGKIDRVALARQVFPAAATDLDAPPHAVLRHAPPRDSIEVTLVDLWRELLGERSIGIHDDFFALGGHSLLAVRLLARLQERLEVTVPLRTFFRHSTVAGLASCLEEAGGEGRRQLPPLGPSNDPSDAPLSFAQQRLWFLDRLEPGSGAYHIARSIPLEGPLDLAALDGALIEIVRRHQALRTVFLSRDGEPRQRLEPTPATLLATVDLRHVEAGHRNDRAQAEIEAAVRRPFDLRQDLMLRALVLRLGETAWELLLDLHHIAADGVSMEVFARELSTAYRARIEPTATGRHRAMPKLAIQYTDFARWQRSWLQGEIRQELLAYWCRQLEGLSTLELPTDRPRPTMASEHGDRLPLVLDPSTTTALKALAVAHGSTLFMVLLAAFQSLLQRHSGQDDIVVGTPIANRTHSALERLIGCFANTLVLRGDLGEDPTAEVLLARLRATCLDAYAHQDMPFEKLVDALEPERDLGRNPLVQVMLSLQQRAGVSLDLGPVSHGPIRARGRAVKLDLHLAVLEDAEQLHGFLEYRRELFDSTTAHRFLRHWQNLLDALTRTPRRRLSRLPMLSPAESHQLRREWNDTRAALPQAEGLHDLIRRQAARTPDAIAVSSDEVDCPHSLSYGQLWRRAESLAHRLAALGVGPETRVAVAMERSCEMMVALLGVLEAGAAYLPLDPAYPPARLAFMLADADCPVL